MKSLSIFLLAAALGLSACKDDRVPSLEKRVSDLESKVKSLEDKRQKDSDAEAQKESDFKECVAEAKDDYDAAVKRNGAKDPAGYRLDLRVMQEIEHQKQSKIEECKLLYR